MFESHPSFPPPDDPNIAIWRYMDFAKLVSLVDRGALFFTTAGSLGDPFEGSYPVANEALRSAWYGEHASEIQRQSYGEKLRRLQDTLISCWHTNESESAAMWGLYGPHGSGIAVQSSYSSLISSLRTDQPIYVGLVRYLRYDTDPMPEGNLFDPFMHKRASFAHERELRAVMTRYIAPGTTVSWEVSQGPPAYFGDYVAVELGRLIQSIRVAPGTPDWFLEAVTAAMAKFGVAAPVVRSELDRAPSY